MLTSTIAYSNHLLKSVNTRVMAVAFYMSSNVGLYLYDISCMYFEFLLSVRHLKLVALCKEA